VLAAGHYFAVPGYYKMKDGATGARRRAGMRAHDSANTQQVERERERVLEEGRCDNILGEG
jgi:hypothetical protein